MACLKEILPVLHRSLRGHFLSTAPTPQPQMLMLPRIFCCCRLFVLRQNFTKLLTMWTRLASNSQQPSCLRLSSTGILGIWHYICLHVVLLHCPIQSISSLRCSSYPSTGLRLEVSSSSKTAQHSGNSFQAWICHSLATLLVQSFLLLLV